MRRVFGGVRLRLGRTLLLVAVIVGAFLLLPAGAASAHAYLDRSNPADGAVLTDAPRELSLAFSESVVLGATSLELVDGNGARFTPTRLRIVTAGPDAGAEDPVSLVADLPPLAHSAYRLTWRTLSRDDLHQTNGVIVFGIRQQVTAAGQREPTPPISEALLRWFVFTGIALAVGGLLANRLYRRAGAPPALTARAGRLALGGSALGAVAAALLLYEQVSSAGASMSEVLSGRYGLGWAVREIGLLALISVAARTVTRSILTDSILTDTALTDTALTGTALTGTALTGTAGAASRPRAVITAGAVLAVAVGTALVGHGGTGGPTRIAADAAHVGAGAIWFGGIAVLLLAGLTALRDPVGRATVRLAFLGFGRPAAISAAALVASGVYLISGVARSADALLETFYGRVLLLKIGLFALALLLGLRNHRALRAGAPRPPRIIAGEACVGLVILALAAVLTSSQPALEPQFIRAGPASATPVLTAPAADLQQTLAIRPNQPGANLVVVEIFNTRRPAPGAIIDVRVSLRGSTGQAGTPVVATPLADSRWTVAITLTDGGSHDLAVTVRRTGLADVTSQFTWNVRALASARHPVLLSNTPLAPPLRSLGLALMLGTGIVSVVVLMRQRRRHTEAATPDGPSAGPSAPVHPSDEAELATAAAGGG